MSKEEAVAVTKDDNGVTKDDTQNNSKKLEKALKLLPTKWVKDMFTSFNEHKIMLKENILFVNHIVEITKDAAGRVWIAFELPRRRNWNVDCHVLNDQIPNKHMGLPADQIVAVMPFSCRHDGYLHLDICGDCNMPVDDIMRIAEEGMPTSKRFIDSDPSIEFANYGQKELIDSKVPMPKYQPGEQIMADDGNFLIVKCRLEYIYDLAYKNEPDKIVGESSEKVLLANQHHITDPARPDDSEVAQ